MTPATAQRLARWTYAGTCAAVIALGVWHLWPTLQVGLFSDDFLAIAMADGYYGPSRAPLDLFTFADGSPEDAAALHQTGLLPWWAAPDFRIAFMRPLSSALLYFDRAVFGQTHWAYHAHSITVWVMLVLAAAALYRRLFSATVAALSVAVFALDESQTGPVIWLCNRGGAYAVLFGVLALGAHLRFRREGQRGYAWISAACLAIALLFGEWALPMFAYFIAFEVFGTTDAWRKRVLALVPAGLLGVSFLAARALLEYGAQSSGVYVDPAEDPVGFALLLLHRVPVLAADVVTTLPSDWWTLGTPWRDQILSLGVFSPTLWDTLPGWHTWHVTLGLLSVAVCAVALRLCWGGFSAHERTHLRWLLLGSVIALMPVVGSFPSSRLTLAACFGFAPALALVVRHIGRKLLDAHRIGLPRFVAFYALGALLLWLQIVRPLQSDMQLLANDFKATTEWVRAAQLDPKQLPRQRVFLLTPTDFITTFFFHSTWSYFHEERPRSLYPISIAPFAHDFVRTGDNVFVLSPIGGGFLGGAETHFRPRSQQVRTDQVFELPGMRVKVLHMISGLPTSLEFSFDQSLDDPAYVFLVAHPDRLARFKMPKVGASVRIPRGAGPSWPAIEGGRYVRRVGPFPAFLRYAPVPWFAGYRPPHA